MNDDLQQARKQLEAILGGPINARTVPGAIDVAGREFLYVGCDADLSAEDLGGQFDKVLEASPIIPRDGGSALTENCTLLLPSGECFFGFSYKGDIEGWRNKAIQGAHALGRMTARVAGKTLAIEDGRQVDLTDCVTRFF